MVKNLDGLLRELGVSQAFGWTILVYTMLVKALLYPLERSTLRNAAVTKMLSGKLEEMKEKFQDPKIRQARRTKLFGQLVSPATSARHALSRFLTASTLAQILGFALPVCSLRCDIVGEPSSPKLSWYWFRAEASGCVPLLLQLSSTWKFDLFALQPILDGYSWKLTRALFQGSRFKRTSLLFLALGPLFALTMLDPAFERYSSADFLSPSFESCERRRASASVAGYPGTQHASRKRAEDERGCP